MHLLGVCVYFNQALDTFQRFFHDKYYFRQVQTQLMGAKKVTLYIKYKSVST